MEINQSFPLSTKEGHQYLITFQQFHIDTAEPLDVPVVNVIIGLEYATDSYNNGGTLNQIAACINDYINANDVILFCYCDKGDIKRSGRRTEISNQEYRSMLFDKMFNKQNNPSCVNRKFIIEASQEEKHYIHLIHKVEHHHSINIIAAEVDLLNDKI